MREQAPCARRAAAASTAPGRSRCNGRGAASNREPLARGARIRWAGRASHDEQGWMPRSARGRGVVALAGGLARGPNRTGLWHAAVRAQAGATVHRSVVRRSLQRRSCLAPAGAAWVRKLPRPVDIWQVDYSGRICGPGRPEEEFETQRIAGRGDPEDWPSSIQRQAIDFGPTEYLCS